MDRGAPRSQSFRTPQTSRKKLDVEHNWLRVAATNRSFKELKLSPADKSESGSSQTSLNSPSVDGSVWRPRSVSHSMVSGRKRILTEQQKALLRHSWNHLGKSGPGGIGNLILNRIISKDPQIKLVFGFKDLSQWKIRYDPVYVDHAKHFVDMFDDIIKSLDGEEIDRCAELLARIGQYHARFADKGFKSDFWDIIAEAMTESVMEWVGPGKHRETIKSWTILVSYVTEEIRYAYRCEVKRRRVNTSSGTGSNRSSTSSSPGPTMASRPFEPPETEEEVLTVTF